MGCATVTEAQLGLFEQIDPGGTRLTELAARSGVAKQSMIELVDRAERAGLVTREPDPADTRAKIVRLTPAGMQTRALLRQSSGVAVDRMATAIGAERVAAVRRALAAYLPAAQPSSAIEQLLAQAARRFVRDVLTAVHRHGYHDVTEALLQLFRNLDLDGARLTDVAARARVTKQSMGSLVGRARALGLVERIADPADRRAGLIRFTTAGHDMLESFRIGVEEAEQGFARCTRNGVAALKSALSAYVDIASGDQPARYSPSRRAASGGDANSPG